MRASLFALLSLISCNPVGEVYSVRSAELQLVVPCTDSGDCDEISISAVPFEREDVVELEIVNPGERALTAELSIPHPDFSVDPSSTNVASSGSVFITIGYAPRDIDEQQSVLTIEHNAGGPAIELVVTGSTDPDADADGYRHELAPNGDDCNDFNAQVNPGTEETWYDGVDSDCDGASDYDQDIDGHDIITRPDGDDCDDEDPRINPDAKDPPGDEIDQDCDGEDG